MAISDEERRRQEILKENLRRVQAERAERRAAGFADKRPLASLAAAERGEKSATPVMYGRRKDGTPVVESGGLSSGLRETLLGGAKVVAGGAAGALSRAGGAAPQLFGGMDPWIVVILVGLLKFIFEAVRGEELSLAGELPFQLFLIAWTVVAGFGFRGIFGVIMALLFYWQGTAALLPIMVVGAIGVLLFKANPKDELVYGGGAFAIAYLDLGLVALLVDRFSLPLTQTMQNLLFFTPWWMFFGVMMSKSENLFVKFLKFGTVSYIIILFVVAAIPEIGHGNILPGLGDVARAKEQLQARSPKGENPFMSQLKCIGEGQFNDLQGCISNRQAESKCVHLKKDGKEQSKEYNECIAQAKGLVPAVEVPGAIDPTQREPTVVTIREGEGFISSINPTDAIPVSIEVKNPRAQKFKIVVGCSVEQTVNGQTQSISGELTELEFEAKEDKKSVRCKPLQLLSPGTAKVKVEALIAGLVTTVWLERFFVGNHKDLADDINNEFFPTKESGESKGPADYVRLDFEIGQPPSEPLIRTEDVQLWATLKNNGDGEIVKLHLARIGPFEDLEVLQTQGCNLLRVENYLTNPSFDLTGKTKEKQIRYGLCDIQMDENLRAPKKPVLLSFISEVVYDYKITRDFSVNVYQTSGGNPS
jgi:hypothetical protein